MPPLCSFASLIISIHAPLAGSDCSARSHKFGNFDFNPRSPRGERLPAAVKCTALDHFNPRSPRGERHVAVSAFHRPLKISIHAPLAGSDQTAHGAGNKGLYFNPRSPRGERPDGTELRSMLFSISIHAPLAGSDVKGQLAQAQRENFNPRGLMLKVVKNFNPRSPRGERPLPPLRVFIKF